jgi:HD-GYP domain-containing protein (c-di-GMP phosphodiesterase class II)/DNA-binding CsgD family transcriptional regulator
MDPPAETRLVELVGALSQATDLAAGLPPETASCTAIIAARLARVVAPELADVAFWAGLLRFVGCTGFAPETARLAGDGEDQAWLATVTPADASRPVDVLGRAVRGAWRRSGGLAAARAAVALADPSVPHAFARAHCAQAIALAAAIGAPPGVAAALGAMHERWDGRGRPAGLQGEAIPLAGRILVCAFRGQVHRTREGPAAAAEAVKRGAGAEIDPRVAEAFADIATGLLTDLEGEPWDLLLDAEPRPRRLIGPEQGRAVADAFAAFVDLKSPWTLDHSQGLGRLADAAAESVEPELREALSLAARLHDLGRCAVPNGIWDKRGVLTAGEARRVREHTWHGERILTASRSELLGPVAAIAARHHERLDGSGYHRGTGAGDLGLAARVLAAGDVWVALVADRPWRRALPVDAARRTIGDEVSAGRLDRRAVEIVLAAAGQPGPGRGSWPDGLSDREVEVLVHLARGRSNKEIAALLGVSAVTVKNHVFHVYEKTEARSRAAAALYAVTRGLLGPG